MTSSQTFLSELRYHDWTPPPQKKKTDMPLNRSLTSESVAEKMIPIQSLLLLLLRVVGTIF